jgi:hypothetical protein
MAAATVFQCLNFAISNNTIDREEHTETHFVVHFFVNRFMGHGDVSLSGFTAVKSAVIFIFQFLTLQISLRISWLKSRSESFCNFT